MTPPTRPKKLLVVDWDYFFENKLESGKPLEGNDPWLYDWGHRETNMFVNDAWLWRAEGFRANGFDLPGTTGEEKDFWKRFNIRKSAPLYIADSNLWALKERIARNVDEVWLYDAHHDCGYTEEPLADLMETGRFECGNWMLHYYLEHADLHVRYPRWRVAAFDDEPEPVIDVDRGFDDGDELDVAFDKVYLCRSGAWTPAWLDEQFFAFANERKWNRVNNVDDVAPRPWGAEQEAEVARLVEGRKAASMLDGTPA